MYYVLERFGTDHPCRWIERWPFIKGVNWRMGSKITVAIPAPIELSLKSLEEDTSSENPEMPAYMKGKFPLFSDELLEAMYAGGVDNLEVFDAKITDHETGETWTNYKAVNIVGVVAAADMETSEATVHPGGAVIDVDFDNLVIDESKAGGMKMFRLAESTNAIMIHQDLRDHLIKAGFTKLEFLEPGDVAT